MSRKFIATYPCAICRVKRVRVYDWMPELVCCAQCQRDVADDEAQQAEEEEL